MWPFPAYQIREQLGIRAAVSSTTSRVKNWSRSPQISRIGIPDARQNHSGVERHLRPGLGQEIIARHLSVPRDDRVADSGAEQSADPTQAVARQQVLQHRPTSRGGVAVSDPLRHPRVDLLAPCADLGGSGDDGGVRHTVGIPRRQILRDPSAIGLTHDQVHPATKVVGNGLRRRLPCLPRSGRPACAAGA
jgi:hypothetical protein